MSRCNVPSEGRMGPRDNRIAGELAVALVSRKFRVDLAAELQVSSAEQPQCSESIGLD